MGSIREPHRNGNDRPDHEEDVDRFEPLPISDDLAGATHAANVAHVVARITLMNLLAEDPALLARFRAWSAATGHEPIVERAVAVLDEIATRFFGFDSRGALFEGDDDDDDQISDSVYLAVESQAEAERLRALPQQAPELLRQFVAHFERTDCTDYIGTAALRLVRDEWRLNWPWLAAELCKAYIYGLAGHVQGRPYQFDYWYEPGPNILDSPMPQARFRVDLALGLRGESIQAALEHVRQSVSEQFHDTFDDPIREAPAGLPRGTFTNPDQIARDVTWWYCVRLRGISTRKLARHYRPESDSRKTVREGVQRAEGWLDLTNWVFDS